MTINFLFFFFFPSLFFLFPFPLSFPFISFLSLFLFFFFSFSFYPPFFCFSSLLIFPPYLPVKETGKGNRERSGKQKRKGWKREKKKVKEKKKKERDEMEKERERNETKESLSVVFFTQYLFVCFAFFSYSSLYLNPTSSLLSNDLVSFTSLFYGEKRPF